ncbi:hypothetical protein D1871_22880 [Nakamurella silvestris]|nr:hypothetical protein D1871_22880 [Nakamurella silvestris]
MALAVVGGAIWWGQWHGGCDAVSVPQDRVTVDLSSVVDGEGAAAVPKGILSSRLCVDGSCSRATFVIGEDVAPVQFSIDPGRLGPEGSSHRVSVRIDNGGTEVFSAATTARSVQQMEGRGNCATPYFTILLTTSGSGARATLS